MAEKTDSQYNSHISFSEGKIALQSYFAREGWGKGVDMGEGGWGERRGGEFYLIAIS